jgi:hypothetical protein
MQNSPSLQLPPAARVFIVALGALFSCIGCSSSPHLGLAPTPAADLSGRWQLDKSASDDPDEALIAAREVARIEGRGQGRPGGRSGGHRGRSGRAPQGGQDQTNGRTNDEDNRPSGFGDGQKDEQRGNGPRNPLYLPSQFELTQKNGALALRSSPQGSQTYQPGVVTTEVGPAGDRKIHAGWEADNFVLIAEGPRGITRTDRFTRSPDGQTLTVETLLKGGIFRDPLRLQRVYHPAPADAAPPAAPSQS